MNIHDIEKLKKEFLWDEVGQDWGSTHETNPKEFMESHFRIMEGLFRALIANTESYRADICYDILTAIRNAGDLKFDAMTEDYEYPLGMFGFRSFGVDGPGFVNMRLANGSMKEIKELYLLTLSRSEDKFIQRLYIMTDIKSEIEE